MYYVIKVHMSTIIFIHEVYTYVLIHTIYVYVSLGIKILPHVVKTLFIHSLHIYVSIDAICTINAKHTSTSSALVNYSLTMKNIHTELK